ncbi:MAG: hypothetical protein GY820_24760 [Gammaproteobacteria bacterium]|nr:hypothetical protein [Gammaproteobacteria bacterium]
MKTLGKPFLFFDLGVHLESLLDKSRQRLKRVIEQADKAAKRADKARQAASKAAGQESRFQASREKSGY